MKHELHKRKSFPRLPVAGPYRIKSTGSCKQGERADLTGCIPESGESKLDSRALPNPPKIETDFTTEGNFPDVPITVYRGSMQQSPGLPPGGKDGWTFWAPSKDYASNYGPNIHAAEISLKNPIDLRSIAGNENVDKNEVAELLAEQGIKIDPKKMGNGEIHQILKPVREEIRKQSLALGFDGLVQNENFNDEESESWVTFDSNQARKKEMPPDEE